MFTPGLSAYAEAHECSHLNQHARRTLAWRASRALRCVPVLGRVAMLAVETEAAAMALADLARCGILRRSDPMEAIAGLGSYVRALFFDSSGQ